MTSSGRGSSNKRPVRSNTFQVSLGAARSMSAGAALRVVAPVAAGVALVGWMEFNGVLENAAVRHSVHATRTHLAAKYQDATSWSTQAQLRCALVRSRSSLSPLTRSDAQRLALPAARTVVKAGLVGEAWELPRVRTSAHVDSKVSSSLEAVLSTAHQYPVGAAVAATGLLGARFLRLRHVAFVSFFLLTHSPVAGSVRWPCWPRLVRGRTRSLRARLSWPSRRCSS